RGRRPGAGRGRAPDRHPRRGLSPWLTATSGGALRGWSGWPGRPSGSGWAPGRRGRPWARPGPGSAFPARRSCAPWPGAPGPASRACSTPRPARRAAVQGRRRGVPRGRVAWVPADAAAELGPLLRWVGVDKVVSHHDPRFTDLCLLDLPDYDSVDAAHRATVDQILPRVDAVCWVLDPEKYNDRVLHEDYLQPLAHHADRAVFVVNRRDVIGDARQVAALTADLRRALQADGISGRPVFVVSAD